MNIGNDLITDRTIRHAIYQEERKHFDAQSRGEGYLRRFTYRFSVTRYPNTDTESCTPSVVQGDETTQILTVIGRAPRHWDPGFRIQDQGSRPALPRPRPGAGNRWQGSGSEISKGLATRG